jgi:2-isopropylmalate synthase
MKKMNIQSGKYRAFPVIDLPDRTWPSKQITVAPEWCSVDLRDGNQAIHTPMTKEKKKVFFDELVEIGFKNIEVGFPSASQTDFDFVRLIIEEDAIPEGTAIQVLVQAREHLIKRTFEALKGAPKIIVHLYNSTSPAQRKDVFGKSRDDIIEIALSGVKMIQEEMKSFDGEVILEYSPESFSLTEQDFALEISNAVIDAWNPAVNGKMVLNLPATVECATANVHADQIEWMCRNINQRENVSVSLHTHNDRGTGVAACELSIMAGADRVEGTLFGNGERTGNTDLLTMALNMLTQGVDPELDFSHIDDIRKVYEECTEMDVHARHPYVGELVYTAFSGSHQDAISKGLKVREKEQRTFWDVPYLPIDPKDVGRDYEAIVKINSQSGKGGSAFVLENKAGFVLPKLMQVEFSSFVQLKTDELKRELETSEIVDIFTTEFLNRKEKISIDGFSVKRESGSKNDKVSVEVEIEINGKVETHKGSGDGAINALTTIFNELGYSFNVEHYDEHAMSSGSDAEAAAYIGISSDGKKLTFGAGTDSDISLASANALISAINRAF